MFQTKFYYLLADLMRCAQWEPFDAANSFDLLFTAEKNQSLPHVDTELYRYYDFSPAMIQFTEERYHDVLHLARQEKVLC